MNNSTGSISLLRSPQTIRERSRQLFERAQSGHSPYFQVDTSKLDNACRYVLELAKKEFPDNQIPFHSRWRHFSVGGIDRVQMLTEDKSFPTDSVEKGRLFYELTIISVLLDAGAGPQWVYRDENDGAIYSRSEGLAVASFDMFRQGLFSSTNGLSADSEGLDCISSETIAKMMQVSDDNPLVGLEGRTQLLQSLGKVIQEQPHHFNNLDRLGGFYDYVLSNAQAEKGIINADEVLAAVLDCFSPIWPGRIEIAGQNLGDIWRHSAVQGDSETQGLIPFHKLSQWLTYSLLEPLIWNGFQIHRLDQLTGLAEYRNGGFFIDAGVLTIKDDNVLSHSHSPDSEVIIEWRALTICLLDEIWQHALKSMQTSATEFPLVKLLEAGTWKAGRKLAKEKRPDGRPPITIASDGTVF